SQTAAATVNGTLALTSGTLSIGTNTLTLNGGSSSAGGTLSSAATGTVSYGQATSGQAVLAANYGNLTFSNFTKVLPSSGTIGVAGTFTPVTATGHTIAGSTIEFNGAGAQTIPAFSYHNLTSSSTGARTLASSGSVKIAGTFTPGGNVYTLTSSTIEYNGTSAQTLPASFVPNNLTINNAAGVSLTTDLTINGTLTLTSGAFSIGPNTLTLNATTAATSGTVSG